MSFICDNCHKVTAPGVPQVRVTVEKRPVTYPGRKFTSKDPEGLGSWSDPGGSGWEIAREETYCPPCAAKPAGAASAH